jgi:hypothetical protein
MTGGRGAGYGLDAELERAKAAKYDHELEAQVRLNMRAYSSEETGYDWCLAYRFESGLRQSHMSRSGHRPSERVCAMAHLYVQHLSTRSPGVIKGCAHSMIVAVRTDQYHPTQHDKNCQQVREAQYT